MRPLKMDKTNDILQLAKRIASKGNTVTAGMLTRMAQHMDEHPMPEFDESGDVPHIESYVNREQPQPNQTHNATVAFAAPHGVSEADIMEYILGIGDALGVKVESFKWSVQESKKRAN
ncbi:MAG: hypothetical protein JSS66_04965 [Armatimonadetes bacterium]|nr:hypothetical protein [Armatimonadota bacterium]